MFTVKLSRKVKQYILLSVTERKIINAVCYQKLAQNTMAMISFLGGSVTVVSVKCWTMIVRPRNWEVIKNCLNFKIATDCLNQQFSCGNRYLQVRDFIYPSYIQFNFKLGYHILRAKLGSKAYIKDLRTGMVELSILTHSLKKYAKFGKFLIKRKGKSFSFISVLDYILQCNPRQSIHYFFISSHRLPHLFNLSLACWLSFSLRDSVFGIQPEISTSKNQWRKISPSKKL